MASRKGSHFLISNQLTSHPFFNWNKEFRQSVQFYLINRRKLHSQLSGGHSFAIKPFQIRNWQICYNYPFVFAKGHFFSTDLNKNLWIQSGCHSLSGLSSLVIRNRFF